MIRALVAALVALALTGCGSLSPRTIAGAVQGHAEFPSLSMAVSDCLAQHPGVRAEVTPAWSRLADKWDAADDLPRDERLIVALANAPAQVAEAEADWSFIRRTLAANGIDCGPAVAASVGNVERTFGELKAALLGNQRVVYALEWAQVLRTVLVGRAGGVVRL